MESSELITIQKYAAMQRLSIHTVIKKTMKGEIPTIVKEMEGKEVTYIVLNPSETKKAAMSDSDEIEIDYKKEYEALHKEHLQLKAKYQKLLQTHSHI